VNADVPLFPAPPEERVLADAGSGPATTSESATDGRAPEDCVPDGSIDDPDDAFLDTNCDGVDGDVHRAVFVAPSGSDGAPGTLGAPVATLAHAVDLAVSQGKDVYVCNGEYDEALAVIEKPVRLYGGYACERSWRRVPDRALVAPANGPALTVQDAAGPVVLERLAFRSTSASSAGQSSIAAVLLDSSAVSLSHVEIEAGDGAAGVPGDAPVDPGWQPQAGAADAPNTNGADDCFAIFSSMSFMSGSEGCQVVPDAAVSLPARTCPDGTTIRGGDGGRGANCVLGVAPESGRAGIGSLRMLAGVTGKRGAPARVGFGQVRQGRYVASNGGGDGQWGYPGLPGKGGDGGSSDLVGAGDVARAYVIGGGGGQGGYPGCGGPGGKGGGGGGASIALLVEHTPVTIRWSRLVTGKGGDGGTPSAGLSGQRGGPGGKGGAGAGVAPGHDGRRGADGGSGGEGGPGAGGPSIGIVHDESDGGAPQVTDTTFVLGDPGRGASGTESVTERAADGIGAETYASTSK
jgi:hypothetical protein